MIDWFRLSLKTILLKGDILHTESVTIVSILHYYTESLRATGLIPTSQVKANNTDDQLIASVGFKINIAPKLSLGHRANCLITVVAVVIRDVD